MVIISFAGSSRQQLWGSAFNKIIGSETVKAKPTGNDSGFITYSKKINFVSKWLDKSVYLITQFKKLVKENSITQLKVLWRTKKAIKVGKISEKDDILTVEVKWTYLIVNNMKISLEMNSEQREL